MEGKTVVAIAHRLSTIAAMDRLIVLDRGRIVEQGEHRTLLSQSGLYARLWAHQSGGFLGEDATEAAVVGRHGDASNDEIEPEFSSRRLEPARIGHDRLTGSDPSIS